MLMLVDCNNFFVSCEKVFNPKLEGKPVVVLSSNDGCVVARSQEAKALGIPMGAPAFECQPIFKKYGVVVFSSNFSLYLDMSRRVMQILRKFSRSVEIYSIDEAFLALDDVPVGKQEALASEMRRMILQWTGLPVSIGIAPTKTLAKVANHYAKKAGISLLDETNRERLLEHFPVQEIWGIGRKLTERLQKKQIYTALEFIRRDDSWIKKEFTVVGLRMAWELRGRSCLELEELADPKKSISTAKSFESLVFKLDELLAIAADYTAYVAEKLRSQDSIASYIMVWIDGPEYSQQASYVLPEPTAYTPKLIACVKALVQKIYREGYGYKRVGVLLGKFVSKCTLPLDLFSRVSFERFEKEQKVMQLVDATNERFGKSALYFACQEARKVRKSFCTPHYTTSWDELFLINL